MVKPDPSSDVAEAQVTAKSVMPLLPAVTATVVPGVIVSSAG